MPGTCASAFSTSSNSIPDLFPAYDDDGGLLVAFGRLSADREFVALQACGVSVLRLVRPVGALALAAWAATR